MKINEWKNVGKWTTILSFVLIVLSFFIMLTMYMIWDGIITEKAIKFLISFMEEYRWWWITLTICVGIGKSLHKFSGSIITDSTLTKLKSILEKDSELNS